MQIDAFKRIVTTFADPQTPLLIERDRALIQLNGNIIEVTLKQKSGEIFVIDGETETPANTWVLARLAQLPLLADRLISTVPLTKPFITPEGDVLQSLEIKPGGEAEHVGDALAATLEALDNRSPLETTVLYITSDAGEGKTCLINEMARYQAARFKAHSSDWLLLPIPLGGRHFLRFDDITVGALQNRYRFPFLYYDAFIELVRLGVLIPAFDGFEEMFVENSSGEALSAMGILVSSLQSCGALVIAARKAYFEFENLKTQERLYDSISNFSVGFGKVGISRWKEPQFLAYCRERGIADPKALFSKASSRLRADHPLITRPVLVRRLADIAERAASLEELLSHLQSSGGDFFSVFVQGIVEREANDKWIDRSGEVSQPLLSVAEHCELLSSIALEMWQDRVDFLKSESLEFVTDGFCETKRKPASVTAQIRERIKGHALLIPSANAAGAVEFDHDEFRQFFLGEAIAKLCLAQPSNKARILDVLRKGALPEYTFTSLLQALKRAEKLRQRQIVNLLAEIALAEGQTSFTHENSAALTLALLSGEEGEEVKLRRLSVPINGLRDKRLINVAFEECFFAPSSLEATTMRNCRFVTCHFIRLDVYPSTVIANVIVDESCTIDALTVAERGVSFYDPQIIQAQLAQLGFALPTVSRETPPQPATPVSRDAEVTQVEKLLRCFVRSTHISENVILRKLGGAGNQFMAHTIPVLLRNGIFVEFKHTGGGLQRHFKIGRTMARLSRALEQSEGSFDRFVIEATRNENPPAMTPATQ